MFIVLQILGQMFLNFFVIRESLAKSYPHARRSDKRIAASSAALPFVPVAAIIPAVIAGVMLDAAWPMLVGVVASLVAQVMFLRTVHSISIGGGVYLLMITWLAGTAAGLLGVIHPALPPFAIACFVGYKLLQRRSLARFSAIADTL